MSPQPDQVRHAFEILQAALAAPAPRSSPTWGAIWQPFKAAKAGLASAGDDVGRARHVLFGRFVHDGAEICFADLEVGSTTIAHVDSYRAHRATQTTRRRGPPAPATVNREVMLLKRIGNFGVEREFLMRNPIAGAPDEDENNIREVVIDERSMMLLRAATPEEHRWLEAFVVTKYHSGMRITEVRLLQWPQLDPEHGAIDVLRKTTKGKRDARLAELSSDAWALLRELPRIDGCPYVFPNPKTRRPWGDRWVHRLFDRMLESAGITGPDGVKVWPHDLRRSYATLSRRRGNDESTVMKRTGHRSAASFRRYNIVGLEDLARSREVNERQRRWEIQLLQASQWKPLGEDNRLPPKRADNEPAEDSRKKRTGR